MREESRLQQQYDKYLAGKLLLLFLLLFCVLFAGVLSLNVGSSDMTVRESLRALLGEGAPKYIRIVYDIRLPRVLGGLFIGMSLALSGLVLQSTLNNPLASPSTLGISSASALGANVAIILFARMGLQAGAVMTSAVSFLFAMLCMLLVLGISSLKRADRATVLLGGVALNALFSAIMTIVQYFADDTKLASAVSWTFGDLGRVSYSEAWLIALVTLSSALLIHLLRWKLNAMDMGEDAAHSLGIHTKGLRNTAILLSALNTGCSVAFAGMIGFVGILAPSMIRRLIGEDKRFMIPASLLMGAFIVVAGDAAARTMTAPLVLPVGAVTSILGAPVFVYILLKER